MKYEKMKRTIEINALTCIQCGKCVKVCPSAIFVDQKDSHKIDTQYDESCIACGHCVDSCPTDSVIHSDFPPTVIHRIEQEQMPSAQQVMTLIKSRRSNRAFSSKDVPSDLLDQILDAAHCAPTASNMQQVSFTLITDPALLAQVSQYTVDVFASVARKLQNPILKPVLKLIMPSVYKLLPLFARLQSERAQGKDPILRGARALIFIHTPSESRFGCQDSNLAYQNGSLMAHSLNVSQFYTGFVCSAIKQDKSGKLAKLLGIKGTIHAGMALGMPAWSFTAYCDRKQIDVRKFT